MNFELDRQLKEWQEITARALWQAQKLGATYADCRITLEESEDLAVEGFEGAEAKITSTTRSVSDGVGVRVVIGGTWGFAAGPILGNEKIEKLVRRAADLARVNRSLQNSPVELAMISAPAKPIFYSAPYQADPFEVSWEEKLKLLLSADKLMREASDKVFKRNGEIALKKKKKILATTDGVFAVQEFMESGAAIQVHTRRSQEDDAQRRSYPDSHVYYMRGGWEQVLALGILEKIPALVKEAEELLYAPYSPEGERDVILLQTMANLHCGHETIHGFEADRVLGTEWTLAGGSFITAILPEIGKYRFGSEHVNIVADSTHPEGVGTFACDDEGAPGQRYNLVKNGVLKNLLTSRETIIKLNRILGRNYFKESGGTMRAMDAHNFPLIRMVNILIEPGEISLDEMKEKCPEGTMMLGTNKSWSIDDVRRHFNFGIEIAWEKVKGEWKLRKNAKYSGDNLNFFRGCKGFANKDHWVLQGIGNCGKDIDPIQAVPTGHGSSPGWFGNVKVGSVGHMDRAKLDGGK